MQWSWRIGGYSLDVSTSDVFWAFFRARFNVAFLIYWAIVGVDHAIANYRRYREGEVDASRARAELARTQLRALKMQLQPHFLFNTLHAVASLMDDDVKAARRVLARLSELLRATLESEGVQEQPLEAELDILRRYVEIEEIRFGDRLVVEWEVEEGTADALVPPFLLQPLVENAIRHGVEPVAELGTVRVQMSRANGRLTMAVEDDGPGLSLEGSSNGGTGIGLRNTRARLDQLYADDHRFRLAESPGGGLRVEIEIPYRREPTVDPGHVLHSGGAPRSGDAPPEAGRGLDLSGANGG
jgi:sensor histidine kinase YesM